ncbi:hypothetical protein GCM10018790_53800 [Kitasatospora xanthocidica]|nr:hypothetical protein GCM10018790_53800 [Kitasatospora xanthocidica]
MAQVGRVVGGDAADVDPGGAVLRHHLSDRTRCGVVDTEGEPLTRQGGNLGGGPGMHGNNFNLANI